MPAKFYLTTTLPYVNADPHIGFAGELVTADILARYHALKGDDVFFNTGTDEHGQKIWEAAAKAGQPVKAYVDHYAGEFKKLNQALGLWPGVNFIRTTDPAHEAAAQEMWRRCAAAGDIYLKDYVGRYCVGCEAYKTERELNAEGRCLLHPAQDLVKLEEKNYFFRFKKYEQDLLKYLDTPGVILPEWRRQEAINFVKEGLEDFSISRERSKLEWGIPVPGDESQVMYVWFDALTNYISCLGWPSSAKASEGKPDLFEEFWEGGKTVQLAGKDQVRFQSLIWQAMLISAGIKNTDQIIYHGFITSGGQKMSKSLGNVINPLELVAEYGTDAVRYFLARHVHPYEDSDVTLEKFKEAYNANLANGLGNLVSRVMKMAEQFPELLKPLESRDTEDKETFYKLLSNCDFNRACDLVWSKISILDEIIQKKEPFKLLKTDPLEARVILEGLKANLLDIAEMLRQVMPAAAEKIETAIKENKMPEPLFPRKD
jgi:methionyl-tRNA synthetase